MIRRVWAISLNTFREALRQKILYGLGVFALALILLALVLGQLSLGADTKIVKDMGLASMSIFGFILAIFLGIGLVFKEIDRKTIYTILSKPVSRLEFLLGKFFGLSLTLALKLLLMTCFLFGMLLLYREPLDFQLLKAVYCIFLEVTVLIAFALVFSSYSSSFMSSIFCISFLLIGHMTDDLREIMLPKLLRGMADSEGIDRWVGLFSTQAVEAISLFNLDHFAIHSDVVHGAPVEANHLIWATTYALCLNFFLISFAVFLFRKKDLQ